MSRSLVSWHALTANDASHLFLREMQGCQPNGPVGLASASRERAPAKDRTTAHADQQVGCLIHMQHLLGDDAAQCWYAVVDGSLIEYSAVK